MSDGLTTSRFPDHPADQSTAPAATDPGRGRRPAWRVAALQALAVVAGFAVLGAVAGYAWYHLWDVPSGVVADGVWYTDEHGLRDDFSGVGLYVALTAGLGLVLGLLSALFARRSELVTLAAVLVGSVLAAYLTYRVGLHYSAPDPVELARTAQDGTRLDGALRVDSWVPRGACTFAALVGLALVYAVSVLRAPTEVGPSSSGSAPLGTPPPPR